MFSLSESVTTIHSLQFVSRTLNESKPIVHFYAERAIINRLTLSMAMKSNKKTSLSTLFHSSVANAQQPAEFDSPLSLVRFFVDLLDRISTDADLGAPDTILPTPANGRQLGWLPEISATHLTPMRDDLESFLDQLHAECPDLRSSQIERATKLVRRCQWARLANEVLTTAARDATRQVVNSRGAWYSAAEEITPGKPLSATSLSAFLAEFGRLDTLRLLLDRSTLSLWDAPKILRKTLQRAGASSYLVSTISNQWSQASVDHPSVGEAAIPLHRSAFAPREVQFSEDSSTSSRRSTLSLSALTTALAPLRLTRRRTRQTRVPSSLPVSSAFTRIMANLKDDLDHWVRHGVQIEDTEICARATRVAQAITAMVRDPSEAAHLFGISAVRTSAPDSLCLIHPWANHTNAECRGQANKASQYLLCGLCSGGTSQGYYAQLKFLGSGLETNALLDTGALGIDVLVPTSLAIRLHLPAAAGNEVIATAGPANPLRVTHHGVVDVELWGDHFPASAKLSVHVLAVHQLSVDCIVGQRVLATLGLTPEYLASPPTTMQEEVANLDLGRLFNHLISADEGQPTISDDLPSEVRGRFEDLLGRHVAQNTFGDPHPGGADLGEFEFVLNPGSIPVRAAYRHKNPKMTEAVRDGIRDMLQKGIIRPSSSDWAAPVLLIRKPDDTWRFCVDYRQLNAVTRADAYPMLSPDKLREKCRGVKYFATFDLTSGFHQLKVAESSRHLTAFQGPNGLYEFNRLPFGVRNGPAAFQRAVTKVFQDSIDRDELFVFIDDAVVLGRTPEELYDRVDRFLTRCAQCRLRLKAKKSIIGTKRAKILGLLVDESGVHISQDRIDAIATIKPPSNPRELRSFLGLVNYLRPFLPHMADQTRVLNTLLGKGTQWSWTRDHQKAFETLKAIIAEPEDLTHPNYDRPFRLRTDASVHGIGAQLFQLADDGSEQTIAFYSKQFNDTMAAWPTIEQEAYGVVASLLKFEDIVQGHHVDVETDHRNLTFLASATNNRKVRRWFTEIADLDISITHIPGADNIVADTLSRYWPRPSVDITPSAYLCSLSHTSQDSDLPDQLAEEAKQDLLDRAHGKYHRKAKAMFRRLKQDDTLWSGIKHDIAERLLACPICSKSRLEPVPIDQRHLPDSRAPVGSIHHLHVDTLGPLPEHQGFTHVLVIKEPTTRFTVLEPMQNSSTAEALNALKRGYIRHWGLPQQVQTDSGSQFGLAFSRELELLGIDHHVTTSLRHEANGAVENVIRSVNRALRELVHEVRDEDWTQVLSDAQTAVNDTPSAPLGDLSPFQAHAALLATTTDLKRSQNNPRLTIDRAKRLLKTVNDALAERSKWKDDHLPVAGPRPAPGDYVYISLEPRARGRLDLPVRGPCRVLQTLTRDRYELQDLIQDTVKIIRHGSSLYWSPVQALTEEQARSIAAQDFYRSVPEEILDYEQQRGSSPYRMLVRWAGMTKSEATWINIDQLAGRDTFAKFIDANDGFAKLPGVAKYRRQRRPRHPLDPPANPPDSVPPQLGSWRRSARSPHHGKPQEDGTTSLVHRGPTPGEGQELLYQPTS
ncbi:Integrase core domain [Carpediemonas membranifera]|uniref:Integrase core domain n=1 Tax=Carpediemonas membranifera TaxID=201153 RepID=A0A8J6AZB3_9EUKA|nr:Integrase core domain [Carpediemonas membranifera]|eukprot:KAG9392073.1 Integrase core domain [Carpediemonas membranifera]